jgi:short-subunit dehydrogenase
MFEVNFWGSVRVIQALVPAMRERKSGAVVNISSASQFSPPPTASMYAASKFALEAITETLAVELSPFNVRVLSIIPGAMKTAFFNPEKLKMPAIPEAYKGTVAEYALNMIKDMHQNAAQDPHKTAEAVVKEVLTPAYDPPISRLPLGKESIEGVRKRVAEGTKLAEQYEKIAAACDF